MTPDHRLNDTDEWLYREDFEPSGRPVMIERAADGSRLTVGEARSVEYAVLRSTATTGLRPTLPHGPETGWATWLQAELRHGRIKPGITPDDGMSVRLTSRSYEIAAVTIPLPLLILGEDEASLAIRHSLRAELPRPDVTDLLYSVVSARWADDWYEDETATKKRRRRLHDRMEHMALAITGQPELAFRMRLAAHLDEFTCPFGWPSGETRAASADGRVLAIVGEADSA